MNWRSTMKAGVVGNILAVFCLLWLAGCGDGSPTVTDGDTEADNVSDIEQMSDISEEEAVPDFNDDPGVLAFFNPDTYSDFYAFPYPADHRRFADGMVNLDSFPNPLPSSLIKSFLRFADEQVDGFSLNGALYVHFTGAILLESLPGTWQSMEETSPVQLVDITPESPEYGQTKPVIFQYYNATTDYYPAHTLAIKPFAGFPLMESTTYALVMTKAIESTDNNPLGTPGLLKRALADAPAMDSLGQEVIDSFAPLRTFLASGLAPFTAADIAVATVFTTQDATGELRRIRDYIRQQLPVPAVADFARVVSRESASYYCFDGHYDSPNFMQGEVPYSKEGSGAFRFEQDGTPIVAVTERLRFRLVIPRNETMPPDGWPIVMQAHGTGGDYESFNPNDVNYPGAILANRGMAAIGIDQPMHGDRAMGKDFDVGYFSFNFTNPWSGSTAFRQSAVDTFVLTNALKHGFIHIPADQSPIGQEIRLDSSRVLFMGHSHGGISGAIAMGLEDDIMASVHSGAGGYLSLTVMYRKDGMDYTELIAELLGMDEHETLTVMHPVITLIQTLVERTDPVNYAPFYLRHHHGGQARDMLFTCGHFDPYTPYQTNEALVTAAGIPVVEPVGWSVEGLELRGIDSVATPVKENLVNAEGRKATGGVRQYNREGDGHFVIFDDADAAAMYGDFLKAVVTEGRGVIH